MAFQSFYPSEPTERTLISFHLGESEIRTATSENSQIWFCAKDVCEALNLSWSGQTLQRMPKDWTCVIRHITQGDQARKITFINEPGVYRLAFRSDKPEAERFCDWVCGEVLPAIRKHGYFGQMPPEKEVAISKELRQVVQRMTETEDAFERQFLTERSRRLSALLGQPVPDLTLIGQSLKQQSLPGV